VTTPHVCFHPRFGGPTCHPDARVARFFD
jgi:hypothetical protein